MIRRMYAAYADKNAAFADTGDKRVKHLSLTRYEDIVFLYYEATEDVAPKDVVSGETRPFPDGSRWFFMPDIFHYSRPLSDEHWERKSEKKPFVRLNRLLPDKVGSYIYYHQQLQARASHERSLLHVEQVSLLKNSVVTSHELQVL